MNVYDFDGTLYRGDSTADFLIWCARRYPRIVLTLPRTGAAAFACLALHAIDKTRFKSQLYRFLHHVPDVEREVKRFWRVREARIGGPCLNGAVACGTVAGGAAAARASDDRAWAPQEGDLVISASPEFLLRDVCARRGLKLIASQVDPHTGSVLGPNCSEGEKVVRFRERFGNVPIERFFSDSRNDDPLARLAKRAYLVNFPHNTISPWEF